ncbi:sperm flagellar protein 1 [Aulostomus maculatus]
MDVELSEEELQDLYAWIDQIPLSRTKRHITRDFSDGVMAAEVVKHFFPHLVDLHNYSPANSTAQKLSNWHLLNRKVFSKLNFHVSEETVKGIVLRTAGVILPVLSGLRESILKKLELTTANIPDLEYYDNRNQQMPRADLRQTEAKNLAQTTEEMKREEWSRQKNGKAQQGNEHALLALQETVKILQMKVSKLEHLVHLKNLRIGELTRLLEKCKANGKTY